MQTPGVAPSFYPAQQANPDLSLKPGQMIYGKVQKIYPNQTADLTIGNVKITARLDAPISIGKGYWFQVQNGGDAKELKVIRMDNAQGTKDAVPLQVLAHLGLSPSKENVSAVKMFIENQLPVTKDHILLAVKWLAENKDEAAAIRAIKAIHSLSLPPSDKIFQALFSFENKIPMQHAMTNLQSGLHDGVSETETMLKSVLSYLLAPSAEKTADSGIQKLVNGWLSFEGALKNQAYRLLQTIGMFPPTISETSAILQVLNQLTAQGGLAVNTGIQEAVRHLTDTQSPGASQTSIFQALSALKQAAEEQIMQKPGTTSEGQMWREIGKLLEQSQGGNSPVLQAESDAKRNNPVHNAPAGIKAAGNANDAMAANLLAVARKLLQNALSSYQVPGGAVLMMRGIAESFHPPIQIEEARKQLMHLVQQRNEHVVPRPSSRNWDLQLIQKLMPEEAQVMQAPLSSMFSQDLKASIRMMGLGFENYLANPENSSLLKENELLTLKPLLIKWMSENASSPYKEHAEMIVHKITGQQLLSQASGPIQHCLVQIPFSLGRFQTDATIQWSGRRKEDGKIDASYCRVLFYLQLENINDTIVDMAVQNKVVKVTVTNPLADTVKDAANPYIDQLRNGLEAKGYRLSSVVFEKPAPSNLPVRKEAVRGAAFERTPYSGVDMKI